MYFSSKVFWSPLIALNSSLSPYFLQSISICGGIFHISVGVCELWHSICQLKEWHAQSDNFWSCHTVWPVCSRVSVQIQVLHCSIEMSWTELLAYFRSSHDFDFIFICMIFYYILMTSVYFTVLLNWCKMKGMITSVFVYLDLFWILKFHQSVV